jgi:hypothetical protein
MDKIDNLTEIVSKMYVDLGEVKTDLGEVKTDLKKLATRVDEVEQRLSGDIDDLAAFAAREFTAVRKEMRQKVSAE